MKYNILKDEIYRTSYLICEPLFLEEDWEGMEYWDERKSILGREYSII
jgi:hypothetical protein